MTNFNLKSLLFQIFWLLDTRSFTQLLSHQDKLEDVHLGSEYGFIQGMEDNSSSVASHVPW